MADKIFRKDQEIMLFQTQLGTRKRKHVMTLKYISNQTIAVYRATTPMRHLVRNSYNSRYVFKSRKMYLDFSQENVLVHVKGSKDDKRLTGVYKTTHRRRVGILDKGMKALLPKCLQ
jgi:hypothetical protein